jgi:hypothetical protein
VAAERSIRRFRLCHEPATTPYGLVRLAAGCVRHGPAQHIRCAAHLSRAGSLRHMPEHICPLFTGPTCNQQGYAGGLHVCVRDGWAGTHGSRKFTPFSLPSQVRRAGAPPLSCEPVLPMPCCFWRVTPPWISRSGGKSFGKEQNRRHFVRSLLKTNYK